MANLQVSEREFIRVETLFNGVLLTTVKHDKDSSYFEHVSYVDIPLLQIDNLIELLKSAKQELNK